MNRTPPNFTRRRFVLGTTAVSTGLAVGLQFNTIISDAKAAAGKSVQVQEVGAWVVIQENDDVIIRVVRSEMGQGTITGLAQLVAEELECEWEKISIEYPSPGESLRRRASGVRFQQAVVAGSGPRKITSGAAERLLVSC